MTMHVKCMTKLSARVSDLHGRIFFTNSTQLSKTTLKR